MSCQCFMVGGPFIAEDPDCPEHGTEAQRLREEEGSRRREIIEQLDMAVTYQGSPRSVWEAAQAALQYLQSLE